MAAGDVNVNALTTITSEPTTTDSLVAVNRSTNEGQIIDYNLLADKILTKLTSKTYSGLSTTSKILIGAINELDSDVSSLNSSLADTNTLLGNVVHEIRLAGNGTATIKFPDYERGALIYSANSTGAFAYVFTFGYLKPIKEITGCTVTLASDYVTITITNTTSSRMYIGFIAPKGEYTISQ